MSVYVLEDKTVIEDEHNFTFLSTRGHCKHFIVSLNGSIQLRLMQVLHFLSLESKYGGTAVLFNAQRLL